MNDKIVQIMNQHLAKIEEENPKMNAFISIASKQAIEAAIEVAKINPEGLLYGMPIAIKDNIVVEKFRLTCASKMLENFEKPLYNATVVQKLIDAGAIILGKLNLDEFAMGGSNETSYFGPVKNAYNDDYVSGGSSGGSAVAVATGSVLMSLGSDTGGSVRQPAAFNNIVGMKPTYGRVSRFGLTAFASSLDQVGILTKTVEQNARTLAVIAGNDPFDTTSSTKAVPLYHQNLSASLAGKKIAVFEEYLSKDVHPEVVKTLKEAIKVYEKMGATVEIVSLPHLKYVVPAYYIIAPSEASSNLARFDGLHYGYRSPEAKTLDEIYKKSRFEGFGMEVKKRILMGTYFLNHDKYDAYYIQAAKLRTLIHNDFATLFQTYDIILGPTTPEPPFKLGEQIDDPIKMYLNDICTIPANLIGLPAISIPGGFTKNGLPIGIQLTGKAFAELELYQFAFAFESVTNYYKQTNN
ncbi:MAG: Asp-tRNA(Asn)/Glu-tRNA(Gln) amidotransferase subunit GatA [Culicoidibacterales bacterium]